MMPNAIVYASKHGATAEVARRIAAHLNGRARLFALDDTVPDLSSFTTVVLGTAVYAGQPMKAMKEFCGSAPLSGKRLSLFVCGMEQDPAKRDAELAAAFPEQLRAGAIATAFLPGCYRFSKMNMAERFIVKRIAKTSGDIDAIDDSAIAKFAAALS
ncbi:MAG: flavodoxin domain-containing protein [Bifidobacteriaceae bacterium]|jgi:menaquinone-dependent protoporphyrinogen oxidase|nr:flavodoxin domain-containing protein [Bifidobacteriaceae bacterium]